MEFRNAHLSAPNKGRDLIDAYAYNKEYQTSNKIGIRPIRGCGNTKVTMILIKNQR